MVRVGAGLVSLKEFIANVKYGDQNETSVERAQNGQRRSANGYRGFMYEASESSSNHNKRPTNEHERHPPKAHSAMTSKR